MRAIVGTRVELDAIRARVNVALGYPRCERLAGAVVLVGGGRHVACECTDVRSPRADCKNATRDETIAITLADQRLGLPIPENKALVVAVLSAAELLRLETALPEAKSLTRSVP